MIFDLNIIRILVLSIESTILLADNLPPQCPSMMLEASKRKVADASTIDFVDYRTWQMCIDTALHAHIAAA